LKIAKRNLLITIKNFREWL